MTTKKPITSTEPDYDAELTKLEEALMKAILCAERECGSNVVAVLPLWRTTIASHLALAFSLGCHYGYRYAGGSEPVGPGIISFGEEDTHDPAGEPHAR